jgi:catechol-2,3-dioxygenase
MKAIEIMSIPVTDQQRSKEFYIKLGFEVLVEVQMTNGEIWLQLGMYEQVTTIALMNSWPFKKMHAGTFHGLILETDDIEREILELKTKGIDVSSIDDSLFGRFAFIDDPDGNGVSIHQLRH